MSRFDWSDLPIGALTVTFLLAVVLVTFIAAFAIGGGTGGTFTGGESIQRDETPAQRLARVQGCTACHSIEPDEVIVGPSWFGIFGETVTLTDGTTVTVDEAYLEESILDATAKVVESFGPVSVMPNFEGILDDQQLTTLINYIKSLGAEPEATETPEGEATPEGETPEATPGAETATPEATAEGGTTPTPGAETATATPAGG
jgi:cytochrome c2